MHSMDFNVSGEWGCTGLNSVPVSKFMSFLEAQNVTSFGKGLLQMELGGLRGAHPEVR